MSDDGMKEALAGFMEDVARKRDEQAFQALYEEFCPRVKGFLMKQGASADLAEDIAQDTLMTAWQKAHLYRPEKGSLATWIFTIARNKRIDRFRKETPWQEYTGQDENQAGEGLLPDEAVAELECVDRVQEELKKLPSDQREILTLSFVHGLSHSEMAAKLGLPLGTVKSKIRLAYQKMRGTLEDLT